MMGNPMMIARFSLDPHNTHYKTWGENEMIEGTIGGSLSFLTGGFVNSSGEIGESGRYYVLFGVCEAAAKLFDVDSVEFVETVFPATKQKQFGISNFTIERRGE